MVTPEDLQELFAHKKESSTTSTTVLALLVGAAAGVAIGILLAPRSGSETRAQLRQTAQESFEKGKSKAKDVKDRAKEKVHRAVDEGRQTAGDAKDWATAVGETMGRS